MGKPLELIVWHCTATPEGREVTADDIRRWHQAPLVLRDGRVRYKRRTFQNIESLPDEYIGGVHIKKITGNGWGQVGYTAMVHLDGRVEILVPYDDNGIIDPWEITNGAKGINGRSRHFVYVGGCDSKLNPKDTRTPAQLETMKSITLKTLVESPCALVAGHYHFANKACPSFNVKEWGLSVGILLENLYQ